MKRHKSLIPLSRQHHDTLLLAQLIKKDAPAYKGLPTDIKGKREYTLITFRDHLVPHFEAEELILIPYVLGKTEKIDKLCEQIISEHQEISVLVELIRNEKNLETNLDKLGNLISLHVRKEERELFEIIQEVFTEGKLLKLGKDLTYLENKKSC
ncbi:MAG: hemerythrin domain-containing protein [Melioribacteraceae bacterium]|nr:hemerythrin domain-containing protein [Melioribacteraceae bacterium]